MSLSSGGWTPAAGHTAEHSSVVPSRRGASPQAQPACHTVLMSVRVSVCHSTIRPLCVPGEVGEEPLQLQLSMDPRKSGDFRLSLQDCSGAGRSATIAEFDLWTVSYEVKTPKCHELRLTAPPHDAITFTFRCEQEAQEWATVLTSSLREAQKATHQNSVAQCPLDSVNLQNTVTLKRTEETCMELAQAIESGDMQSASTIAATLSRQLVKLKIQPSATNYEHTEISLTVVVEDSASSCSVTVKVFPSMTTAALKQQMFLDYGFHPRVQRWVIGQCLCADQRSLASYGVHRDGDTAFLYLLAARHARLSPQVLQQDQESALLLPPLPVTPQTAPTHAAAANGPSSLEHRLYATLPPRLPTGALNRHMSDGSDRGISTEIKALINLEMSQLDDALSLKTGRAQGWPCPSCTFINKPTRPGCEICSANRPESYIVPGKHRPDALELQRIQQEKETVRQYQQEKGRREVLRSAGAQYNSLLFNLDQDY